MNSYRYRITVEKLAGARGEPVEEQPLVFEVPNHDDLLQIAKRVSGRWYYSADESAAMAIGFKLLAEVALLHRQDALFTEIRPALREFIGKVKRGPEAGSQTEPEAAPES